VFAWRVPVRNKSQLAEDSERGLMRSSFARNMHNTFARL